MVTPRKDRTAKTHTGRRTIKSQKFTDGEGGQRYIPVCLYHAHPGQIRRDDSGCTERQCTHYSKVYFQMTQRRIEQPFSYNGESEDCKPAPTMRQ